MFTHRISASTFDRSSVVARRCLNHIAILRRKRKRYILLAAKQARKRRTTAEQLRQLGL